MKVFFLGNSYTYFNDLPKMFSDLCSANGKETDCSSLTVGGYHLYQFADTNNENGQKLNEIIKNHSFDFIFLQDQSLQTITDPKVFEESVDNILKKFENHYKKAILYETWSRKEGNQTLKDLGISREEMTFAISDVYTSVGKKLNIDVSHVGLNFYKLNTIYPEIELYNPDLGHPSYIGSCLAAVTHYKTLFSEIPEILPFELDENSKNIILNVCEEELC